MARVVLGLPRSNVYEDGESGVRSPVVVGASAALLGLTSVEVAYCHEVGLSTTGALHLDRAVTPTASRELPRRGWHAVSGLDDGQ